MSDSSAVWSQALARYSKPARLETLRRGRSFTVMADGQSLRVKPDSSGCWRPINHVEFDRCLPLLGRASREELQVASWNSSYIEAIEADMRGGARPDVAVHQVRVR
jgi:hypothetical protein